MSPIALVTDSTCDCARLGLLACSATIVPLHVTVGERTLLDELALFKRDPASKGRVMRTGAWRYTRHPNYFGEATLWWGVWLVAAAAHGYWSVYGAVLITLLLLRVFGVTLLEKGLKESKPGYAEYIARTSAFIPWRPKR